VKVKIDLEDTFGDIVRKASRGTKTSAERLSQATGVSGERLSGFLADKIEPSESEACEIAKALALDPDKFSDSGLRRWYPSEPKTARYLTHQINAPHPSNGYFLILREQGVGAFVDPAGNPTPIIEEFKRSGVALQYILLTHKHRDHSDALGPLRKAFPSARPVIHELDAREVGDAARGAIGINDGDSLPFGPGEVRMLHTPGHTDGSSCFIYDGQIFTGDTMFAGSVGGLFGDQFGYPDLLHSIRTKILSLDAGTVVLPGHGPASTIAQERAHNPFF
jgi:glyoxylase-like metal-dependent hydrolase (beta-lactamase superfamily II)